MGTWSGSIWKGSALTQKTIEVFEALQDRFSNLQAFACRPIWFLHRRRSGPLNAPNPRSSGFARGPIKSLPDISFRTKGAVDANYRVLTQKLLDHADQGAFPAFCHPSDLSLIDYILQQAKEKRLEAKHFEFQMLYGIQNKKARISI